jgi:hypothetical protein
VDTEALQKLLDEAATAELARNCCPLCRGPLVGWYSAHAQILTEQGKCSRYRFKAYCCSCRQHYEKLDHHDWKPLLELERAPSHEEMETKAIKDKELAKAHEASKARKAKARVWVRAVDADKPRFSQFFQFVCPFCSHSEEVGLWYTSKTCPQCGRWGR